MSALLRASFFLAVALIESATLVGTVLPLPGIKAAEHIIRTDECYLQPGFAKYPILGDVLNKVNCEINSIFLGAVNGPKAGHVQMTIFGSLFLSSIVIGVYESFRPVHRRGNFIAGLNARAAELFLMLGQRVTAGFSTPLQLIFTTWSTSSGLADKNTPQEKLALLIPEKEHVWSTLLSMVGFIIPTHYTQTKNMEYLSLTIWQPFPFYILALNIILPPILRGFRPPRTLGIILIALLCTAASLRTHNEMVSAIRSGKTDIRDIFLLRSQGTEASQTFSYASHALFVVDYTSVLITTLAAVLTPLGATVGSIVTSLVPFVILSVLAGPGAALILLWASRELGLQKKYSKLVKGKK